MYNKQFKRGREAELLFTKLFKSHAMPSALQDMRDHFDVEIPIKVDIKSRKNTTGRSDNDLYTWVEIKNVDGKLGWLYGEADVFAFELEHFWLLVIKEDLQRLIADKCIKEYRDQAPYYLYTRAGKSDIITLVPIIDIIYICYNLIEKTPINENE